MEVEDNNVLRWGPGCTIKVQPSRAASLQRDCSMGLSCTVIDFHEKVYDEGSKSGRNYLNEAHCEPASASPTLLQVQ